MTAPAGPPLVTTVIAVRNGERFLAAAIESVLAQTYSPVETIVVDGGSTDSTERIVRCYPGVGFRRQLGQGIPDAYNTGIQAAAGDFVGFLSHDDLWAPTKLQTQMEYLLSHPAVVYVVTKFRYFLEPGIIPPRTFRRELLGRDLVGRIMETLLACKSAFQANGRFDPTLALAHDVDWFARAKDRGVPMAVIPEVLLQKRVHDANASSDAQVSNQDLLRVLRESIRRQRTQPQPRRQ
jgi:glycosyltransferase involved in cell wall biosynthesis